MAYDSSTTKVSFSDTETLDERLDSVARALADYRTTVVGGRTARDIGMLCTSPKINMWAKNKPVRHPALKDLASVSTTGYRGADGDCGIVPYPLTSDEVSAIYDNLASGTSFPAVWNDSNRGWTHKKPRGLASNEPYRLEDFNGYRHNINPYFYPIMVGVSESDMTDNLADLSLVSKLGKETAEMFISIGHIKAALAEGVEHEYQLVFEDIEPIMGDMYAGLLLCRMPKSGMLPAPGSLARTMVVGSKISEAKGFMAEWDFSGASNGFSYKILPVLWADNYPASTAIADRTMYLLPKVPVYEVEVSGGIVTINATEGSPSMSPGTDTNLLYDILVTISVGHDADKGITFTNNTATIDGLLPVSVDLGDIVVQRGFYATVEATLENVPVLQARSHTLKISLNGGEYVFEKEFTHTIL